MIPPLDNLLRSIVSFGHQEYPYCADEAYPNLDFKPTLHLLSSLKRHEEKALIRKIDGYYKSNKVAITWQLLLTLKPFENFMPGLFQDSMATSFTVADAPGLLEAYNQMLHQAVLHHAHEQIKEGVSAEDVVLEVSSAIASDKSKQTVISTRDSTALVKARLDDRMDLMRRKKPLILGFESMDAVLGGFYPGLGDLITLFAHTNHGKSAALYNLDYINIKRGCHGLHILLEETAYKPEAVMLSLHSQDRKFFPNPPIPYDVIYKLTDPHDTSKTRFTKEQERFLFEEVQPDLMNLPGHMDFISADNFTVDDLRGALLKHGKDNPVDFFVIDYPALMTPTPKSGARPNEVLDRATMIQDIKNVCTHFQDGFVGILAAQAKDESAKHAGDIKKGKGYYGEGAMKFSSALYTSSTHIFSLLVNNELRRANATIIETHKTRDSARPDRYTLSFNPDTQQLLESDVPPDHFFTEAQEDKPQRSSRRNRGHQDSPVEPVNIPFAMAMPRPPTAREVGSQMSGIARLLSHDDDE